MSYNSNRGNYNNNSSLGSGYSSSGQSGNSYIPSSRRPDGTYREEVRVRPGFIPEAERQSYITPAARSSYSSNYNPRSDSQESLEDRVDSWADEDAPVIYERNKVIKINAVKEEEKLNEVKEEASTADNKEISESSEISESENDASITTPAREPRKPSQLAAAIDTALDSLSIGSPSSNNDGNSSRQIGRFASQIANDEREGRTYRRYEGYSNNYSNSNRFSGHYNRDRDGQCGYNRPYNNWNRNGSSYKDSSNTEETNGTASNSSENRVENEFKSFLDQLTVYRREMALINAKLEYIRYVKSRDTRELTEIERERLATEAVLVSRLDSIFESIDSLSLSSK